MSNKPYRFYMGTSAKSTFKIIAKHNQNENYGVCLNMFKFNKALVKKMNFLEMAQLNLFMDNGSFERFMEFIKEEVSADEYFNYDNSNAYFSKITGQYKELLSASKHPERIILTIPEVIGSGELTQALQNEYIQEYKEMEKTYGCQIIISLQFNPHSEEWKEEAKAGAEFLKINAPKSWIIGVPFGNDFKLIHTGKAGQENFKVIKNIFKTTLQGREAHLFACGSPTKIEKYVQDNTEWIFSIDASSLMKWSSNSHYFSKISKRNLDIRYLNGKQGTEQTIKKKRDELEADSGISWELWIQGRKTNPETAMSYEEKFEINFKNFTESYNI
jgi:hypothetical protein